MGSTMAGATSKKKPSSKGASKGAKVAGPQSKALSKAQIAEKKAEATSLAAAEAEEAKSPWSGRIWKVPMPEMMAGGGSRIIEGKKLVMEGRTPEGLDSVMDEARKNLIRALTRGETLYVLMTICAADLSGKYCGEDTLPALLWDREAVSRVVGETVDAGDDAGWSKVMRADDFEEFSSRLKCIFVDKGFRVVVCSHFSPDDYEDFLRGALPLEKFQPIVIENVP